MGCVAIYAWGGNWFFLVSDSPVSIELKNVRELTDAAVRIGEALRAAGITGEKRPCYRPHRIFRTFENS